MFIKLVIFCLNVVLGDIDLDCFFDIVDVVFIIVYIVFLKIEFIDSCGMEMKVVLFF